MIRTATHVVGALRLPAARGRVWALDIAIDADRDAWTQAILHAETTGRRWMKLTCLIGPPARLDRRRFLVEGQRSGDEWTFEFALPLLDVGTDRGSGGVWRFQVRATANEYGRISTLYYQPQPDRRLLPERYGLLQIPPTGR